MSQELEELESRIKEIGYSAALREVRGDVVKQRNLVRSFVKNELKEGIFGDYGPIPGFGDKPTLLKPGAEKLCALYDVVVVKRVTNREFYPDIVLGTDKYKNEIKGLLLIEVTVELIDRETGRIVATGVGAASNQEIKLRKSAGEIANNVVKFAAKRGQVDATITLTQVSDLFTQDLEDMAKEDKEERTAKISRPAPSNDSAFDDNDDSDDEPVVSFGTFKGTRFSDPSLPDSNLLYYAKQYQKNIDEGKFVKQTQPLLDAALAAVKKRGLKI